VLRGFKPFSAVRSHSQSQPTGGTLVRGCRRQHPQSGRARRAPQSVVGVALGTFYVPSDTRSPRSALRSSGNSDRSAARERSHWNSPTRIPTEARSSGRQTAAARTRYRQGQTRQEAGTEICAKRKSSPPRLPLTPYRLALPAPPEALTPHLPSPISHLPSPISHIPYPISHLLSPISPLPDRAPPNP
jgi:hypothetical protein